MKRLALIVSITLLPLLTACNTMEGIGKDLRAGGETIAKSADKNKNY